jgi:hypothetical protein
MAGSERQGCRNDSEEGPFDLPHGEGPQLFLGSNSDAQLQKNQQNWHESHLYCIPCVWLRDGH